MDSGSRSDIEASDIATSESRSEDWGKGTSLSCLAFYETKRVSQALVTRLYAARTSLTVGGSVVELIIKLPLEGHGGGRW